jgi:hypothetical protein
MKHHRIFYNVFTKVERKIYLPFWSFSRKSKKKKEENNFLNRDVNACKNILLLGKCYLESQTRPEEFTRKVIKTEKVNKSKKTNK